MKRAIALPILLLLTLAMFGCDKERIVESTEYIKDVQYIEQPPDTILMVDTIYTHDSSTTVIHDTVYQVTNHYDTVYSNTVDTVVTVQSVFDTIYVSQTDTVIVNIATTDTVIVTVTDTITVINTVTDTVTINQNNASSSLAFGALTYYSNTIVLDFINTEYGITEGFIFYLNEFQSDVTQSGVNQWDIYGLIDFWTTDFTGFEALEFYWRLTYTGGDPSDPNSWTITDPPGGFAGVQPGIHAVEKSVTVERMIR